MKVPTDPIAQLMQEHDDALLQLKYLNKAMRMMGQYGYRAASFRQVTAALKFIEEEVSIHNRKEETALFPVLERYVEGPTQIMRSDHRKLRRGFTRLSKAIGRVKKNHD